VDGEAEGSVFGSVGEAGVSVPAVPGERALSLDEDESGDAAESSAHATPFPVAMAVPIPKATARRPTRPM
jgi:hypothetical protein